MITEQLIFHEFLSLSKRFKLDRNKILNCECSYSIYSDKINIRVVYGETQIKRSFSRADLRKSLDDFSTMELEPILVELVTSEIVYDDAGQIV